MKRILIVKLWALGDILMATPLLRALKRQWPDSHISWFVEKAQSAGIENNLFIDEVIAFDSATWRRQYRYMQFAKYFKTSFAMRNLLLEKKFDIVINLTAEKWWSVWFTVAPIRIGLFPRQHAGLIGKMYTHVIERTRSPWLHNTQHYLLPARALGIPEPYDEQMVVGISEQHKADIEQYLSNSATFNHDKPLVILHPGTSQASKCWTVEQFAQLAGELTGFNVVITGSPSERSVGEKISKLSSNSKTIVVAGDLPKLGQTTALISRADAVVTGDTSVLHIASAVDTPLVGIYGSTRPRDNAPLYGRSILLYNDSVPCAPCYKSKCPLHGNEHMRCMKAVTVNDVINALTQLGIQSKTNDATTQVQSQLV